jgi:CIC family chloride channel protein
MHQPIKNPQPRPVSLGDFTTDRRVFLLLAMALVVGAAGAFGAWVLLRLIALVSNLAWFGKVSTVTMSLASVHPSWWVVAIPPIGGLLVGLMARYGSDKIRGHGIPEALEAILIGGSRMSPKVAVLKPLSSAISIGSGGPFGAEGPIIMTGGAFGSLFAQCFQLSSVERKTLLVAGAAAGMTGIFNTPIAAVLLAVELMLFEWKPRSLLPVIAAVLVATTLRPFLLGSGALFPFADNPAVTWWVLPLAVGVGLIAGLQSSILTGLLYGAEDLFHKLPVHWMWWPAIGGVVVGLGGLIAPGALGVGYDLIGAVLTTHVPVQELLRLMLVKAGIWIVALASGTSGGVLAPLLILGGTLGALEGTFLPGHPGFWALLGMAATMGGTMRAPLTGALFAVELTGDLSALPATLAATGAAYMVTVLVMKRSILTEKVARRGHHISCEYSVDPFEQMRVSEIMVDSVDTLPASQSVDATIAFFTTDEPRHKTYPVVDADGRLVGQVHRSDVLSWIATRPSATRIGDVLSNRNIVTGSADELVASLADRMVTQDVGRAPIVDAAGRVVGLVARKDILRVRASVQQLEKDRSHFLLRRSGVAPYETAAE